MGTRNTIVECGQVLVEEDRRIAWLHVNREEKEDEEVEEAAEEKEEGEEEEEEEKTKNDEKKVHRRERIADSRIERPPRGFSSRGRG